MKKSVLSDTKPTPNGQYYQHIHPCELHKPKYSYRYLGVIKDGKIHNSKPYADIQKCHEDLKRLIEGDEAIKSTPVRKRRKST